MKAKRPRGWRRGHTLLRRAMEAAGGVICRADRETLLAARRAVKALTTTNCGWDSYEAREYLATCIDLTLCYRPPARPRGGDAADHELRSVRP